MRKCCPLQLHLSSGPLSSTFPPFLKFHNDVSKDLLRRDYVTVVRRQYGTEATKALCLAMFDLFSSLVTHHQYYYEAKIPTNVKATFSIEHTLDPEGWSGPGGSLPASAQTLAQLKCLQLLSGMVTRSTNNANVLPMVKKGIDLWK